MTAKTPDPPQESRPATSPPSTSPVPAQPTAAAASPTQSQPARPAAPAATAPGRPKRRVRSRGDGSGLAFPVAVLAVLIAIGSTIISVYALDQARQAKSRMADSGSGRAAPTATPPATRAPTAAPTATTPRVQFAPEIVRGSLRIPPADGCASVFVDIDAMQVGIDNGHEFYLSSCLGAPTLRIDKTSGAVPTQENPTPEVCIAQLAGSTTNTELVLQVRTGLTFCLLTNKDEATRQNIPQRVGIVEVRDLGSDKSVTVAVSTYRVPA